jgi:UDP-2,3-diacylglucosamine pyrophosphatase LpxH
MRTVILSDIHLGSRHCNTALLHEVLDQEPFERLILNGDTLNSVNLRKLSGSHWQLLDRFRKLGRSRELVLIRGNHDHDGDHVPLHITNLTANGACSKNGASNGDAESYGISTFNVLPSLLEVPMREDYLLDVGGASYLVLHGDRFDPTLNSPMVTEVACFCYQLTTKVNKKVAKWLKKKSNRWSGVLGFVRGQSVAHALKVGVAGVITGHTHFAEDSTIDNVHYLNTGCWTEYPCTYIAIDGRNVSLKHPSE